MQSLSLFESNSQPFIIDNLLSFNFNDPIKQNLTTFYSLTETKSYAPITGCVLEHIITTTNLTSCEKLYYLLANSLSIISKNKGYGRYCALPSEDWAERLGCSRSLVFTMQQSLVKKGYFIINKDFDEIGRNNRNLITPTLPTSVFNHLNEKSLDRVGDHAPYNPLIECKRSYLDRTKLFMRLNYNLLKLISSNEYANSRQKVTWLGFYTSCYKNYMLLAKKGFGLGRYSYSEDSSFSFVTSYKELAELYSCNTKYMSKTIRALEKLGFIKTKNIYIRKKGDSSNGDDCMVQERQDKSLWKITLSLPDECILELEKVKDIKSNLGATPKVIFNNFLKRFRKNEPDENAGSKKEGVVREKEFDIHSELIRAKLKVLPKDKAEKARKFAYSLVSKGLARGYAASLSKHELAKQIIHHAASWKPTKFGNVSREKEIDTALSVAWKKIVAGIWQVPLELAKAEILQYEFNAYRRKYQESGVLSHEAKALESDVNSLLGGWCDLTGKITGGVKVANVREWEVSRDSEVAVYSSTKTSLGIRLEDNGYEERFNRSEYSTSECSFAASSFGKEECKRFDYGFPEIEGRDKLLNVDLSHIPEEQRYLKVTPSDNDDSTTLETINGKEYFVKLKELEMNEEGEFVMTFRSAQNTAFLERGTEELLTRKISTSHVNCAELLLQEPQIQKGFIKIDNALSSILNNINCNKT